jgi:hypothetical protein
MENPDIWIKGAKEGKEVAMPKAEKPTAMPSNTNADIANRIRNKKQRGALSAIDFGISVTIYNGALDFMASQVDKGTKLGNAIANTIKWIDEKMAGAKWNKGAFGKYMNDTYSVTLPNGREIEVVRDDSKETAEVINGWYSDLEQKILDSKEERLPAATWAKRLKSKEDEDLWTGLRDFLERKKPSEQVSKKELRDWMKDNRVEISEVIKTDKTTKEQYREDAIERGKAVGLEVEFGDENEIRISVPSQGSIQDFQVDTKTNRGYTAENYEVDVSVLEVANDLFNENRSKIYGDSNQEQVFNTKFSKYQLEGDKENYKELLVTLPSKNNLDIISNEIYQKQYSQLNPEERVAVKRKARERGETVDESNLFKSSHYDEPNILVHLRMNTRTDANGNKVLFLEEVQSDWGQKGKKEGFGLTEQEITRLRELGYEYKDGKVGMMFGDDFIPRNHNDLVGEAAKIARKAQVGVPTAPFVMDTNAWTKLGLKMALKEAVKQGADKIAWTTGEQQNDRYDLSKQVKFIDYSKNNDGTYNIGSDVEGTSYNDISISRIEEIFGKEIAEKVQSETGVKSPINSTQKRLEGLDLKVGGKGMKGFYGSPSEGNLGIVGNVAKSLFKQELGTVEIGVGKETIRNWESAKGQGYKVIRKSEYKGADEWTKEYVVVNSDGIAAYSDNTEQSAINGFLKYFSGADLVQPKITTQASIDITPEMRESAEKGLSLFGTKLSPEQELKQAFDKWKAENNKVGIVPNWERQAKADIELFKAVGTYLAKKLQQGAYSFEKFIGDLGKINIEKIDEQRVKWKGFYDEAVAKGKAQQPPVTPPPVTPTEEGKIKERKTITSIKDATDISDSVKEALGGDRTKYEVLPNQVSVKEATAILDAIGADKAKEMVLTNSKEMPSAFRTTLAQVLIKQYNKEGKFQDAVDVAEGIAEIATDWGQGIQALSMFEYLTPEGQLLAAQREIDRQRNKRFVADKGKIDKLKTALKKADDEAVAAAVESVVADTTPAPEATRPKTWGEKNKIVTKSIYEAAKKALKKIKLFSTPLPEELITIAAYHIEAGARSFADFSKEMIKDFGRKVKPYLKAAYKNAQAKVGGTGYSSDTEIAKHLATDLEKDIQNILKESGVKIRDVIKQHYSEGERTKEALTKALVEKLGLDEGDASVIAEKVNEVFTKIANEKKQQALKSIEKRNQRKTPVRKTAEQKLIELSNLGALDEKAFKEEYARAMGFPELTAENAAAIKELAEKVQQAAEGRPKQKAIVDLLNYQANIKGIDAIDVGTAIWMASILSGPVTQAKNIFGNVFNMSTLLFDMALTNPKDLPFILKGLSVGLGNGVAEGGTTLVTGYPPMKLRNEAMGILERTNFGKLNPYQSLKYVTRFMLASDALTYGGLREMRAYQKALSEARDKYPSVDAVQKAIEILGQTDEQYQAARETAKLEYDEEVARIEADNTLSKKQRAIKKRVATFEKFRRVYDLIEQNRPESLVADAHDFAAKGTFTNTPTGTLGVGARFLNGVKHNIKLASLAVPFTNTIANVANNVINYTPLGYVRAARGGSILMGRQKEFTDEDKARMVRSATLGLTAAVATYILSAVGGDDEDEEKNWFRITAEGYGDYKKNKELEATGWKPYSIKIGDTWWSYQLTPLMGILSAVGAIRDYEKYHNKKINESDMNKLVIPIQVMLSTIAESSYLSSVEGLLSALLGGARGKDPVQELTDWITKTGAAVVPIVGTNFYQQNAQMIQRFLDMPDKEYRGTYFGKMLRNIPYARDQYFNTVNGLGEEMLPPRLNILYSNSDGGEYAKLWQLMADKNQVTSKPERNGASYIDINSDEKAMTDEQFYMFSKIRGEYIRNLMMVNYDNLKEMDEEEFTKWMQSTKSKANSWANGELALQYEKGIYEKNIQPFKAEASHERDRMVYAIEKGDTEEAKTAFSNYEKLSPQSAFKDRKALFTEIVDDKVAPAGIKPADRIDFYKGVLLGDNRNIKIEQKQPDGKVKMVQKPFNEIFTEEERADFKRQYFEQEETVAKKLKVLDDVLERKYSEKTGGEALWRRYVKRANKK